VYRAQQVDIPPSPHLNQQQIWGFYHSYPFPFPVFQLDRGYTINGKKRRAFEMTLNTYVAGCVVVSLAAAAGAGATRATSEGGEAVFVGSTMISIFIGRSVGGDVGRKATKKEKREVH
jgi:hypothetical protein